MDDTSLGALDAMAFSENRFASLYRTVAHGFGLSENAMWVLYFVQAAPKPLSQQDLVDRMAAPKQTVNSAVATLVRRGLVELRQVPGTRNRKDVLLTASGQALARSTVARLRAAEEAAARALGAERMRQFVQLHDDFYQALCTELQREELPFDC